MQLGRTGRVCLPVSGFRSAMHDKWFLMEVGAPRTADENLFDLFIATPSQELEPPQNPGRFTQLFWDGVHQTGCSPSQIPSTSRGGSVTARADSPQLFRATGKSLLSTLAGFGPPGRHLKGRVMVCGRVKANPNIKSPWVQHLVMNHRAPVREFLRWHRQRNFL